MYYGRLKKLSAELLTVNTEKLLSVVKALANVKRFTEIKKPLNKTIGPFFCLTTCSNVSTTLLWQWGSRQCLPFSWTTLRGKY